jgi:hypothetical protein
MRSSALCTGSYGSLTNICFPLQTPPPNAVQSTKRNIPPSCCGTSIVTPPRQSNGTAGVQPESCIQRPSAHHPLGASVQGRRTRNQGLTRYLTNQPENVTRRPRVVVAGCAAAGDRLLSKTFPVGILRDGLNLSPALHIRSPRQTSKAV